MNLHEYQGKTIFKQFAIPVLEGGIANTPDEALEVAKTISPRAPWVIKAQVHAGGRGKGGGIKVAQTLEEVKRYAQDIIGMTLITPQTGEKGKKVGFVYVEAGCTIAAEYYLSITLDRARNCILIIASSEGGVNIEDVAHSHPEKVLKVGVDPMVGLRAYQVGRLAKGLGFTEKVLKGQFTNLLQGLYEAFRASDASMMEINPLVRTKENQLIALDARVSLDENALFRHPDLQAMYDPKEEDPDEVAAKEHHLNYIKLDGNIGCMVNGAGLAMATMDIIKYYGGAPANFLDVGGGATREQVREAFKIILSDKHVKGILVNIFGGIMKCDVIAAGIIEAAKDVKLSVPLVVRLAGTNVEKGKEILESSGLPIITADDLAQAAQKVVDAIKEGA